MAATNRLDGLHTPAATTTEANVAQRCATTPANVEDLAHDKARCLTDVRYALRQLRQFRDIGRAVDALERVESVLSGE